MSYQSETSPRSIEIGRVISRAFAALRNDPAPFLIIGGGLVTLPDVAIALLVQQSPDGPTLERLLNAAETLSIGVIARAALIFAALKVMQGSKVTAGEALAAGVRLWAPVLGISLLTGIGAGLATLLLIVPGVFLAVAWSIALPIRVDGKPGVTDAMVRSFEMTRGSRWAIFAVWLVFWVVLLVCFAVLGALSGVLGGSQLPLVDLVVVPVLTGLAAAMTSALSASIYQDLTQGRGAGPDRTAAVFD